MKAWTIAWKDLVIRSRDWASFIVLIVMPLIVIMVLGLALGPLFQGRPFNITVALADLDKGQLAVSFRGVLRDPGFSFLQVKEFGTAEEAREAVRGGSMNSAVVIPAGFSSAILGGNGASLEVYANPDSPISGKITKSIALGFTTEILARSAAINVSVNALQEQGLITPEEIPTLVQSWIQPLAGEQPLVRIESEQMAASPALPAAMDYYAVSMGVMYALFAANYGARAFLEEKRTGTLVRLLGAPVLSSTVLAGKILSIFLLSFVQFALVVLFASVAFGVRWGTPWGGVVLMMLASVLAMAGIGAFLASIYRSEGQAAALGPAIALALTFLGGGMFTFYGAPPWLDVVSHASPVRWLIDGFVALMTGKGIEGSLLPAGVLLAIGAIFSLFGFLRLQRMRYV